jgi:NADH-quinone oxidoreductase subunit K
VSIGPDAFLLVSAVLFSLGVLGVLLRRGVISILISIELMLNSANLAFIPSAARSPDGQIFAFFVGARPARPQSGLAIVSPCSACGPPRWTAQPDKVVGSASLT